jgi:hypothetical protein
LTIGQELSPGRFLNTPNAALASAEPIFLLRVAKCWGFSLKAQGGAFAKFIHSFKIQKATKRLNKAE